MSVPALWRASFRHLLRHPWQTGLSILAVALGVALVVSIDLSIQSAERAFTLSAEAVSGRATHRITGGPAGIPESTYVDLRVRNGVRPAAPVVEAMAAVAGTEADRTLRLLGVDPFAERPFRPYLDPPASRGATGSLLTEPGAVLLAGRTADALGLRPGDAFDLRVGGARRTVRLAGTIRPRDELSRRALSDLVVADIATAQELLGREGRLDRIDLIVPDGAAGEARLERIREVLPPGARIEPAGTQGRTMRQMTRAFGLNLTALSLLALVFGGFLIYNSVMFSVVRRRRLIGILRATGVTRREVFGLVLAEAIGIGIVGAALGVLLGIALGHGLVRLVTRTINDLYFVVSVRDLAVTPAGVAKGAALGVATTVFAALAPAIEAAGSAPRSALRRSSIERTARGRLPRAAAAGAGLLLTGALLLTPGGGLVWSFAAVFVGLIGCALLVPAATAAFTAAVRPALRRGFGVIGGMAARGVTATLSRTAPAIAALVVAIAVGLGLGIMVDSFRGTVVRWLDTALPADVYVSAAGPRSRPNAAVLDPSVIERVRGVPGVAGTTARRVATVSSPLGPTRLVALESDRRMRDAFRFKVGSPEAAWTALRDGAVLVSEPYAYHHGLDAASSITLRTGRGARSFPVAGVIYDYGSDRGLVVMDRSVYTELWDDPGLSGLGVFAEAGRDADALADAVRAAAGGEGRIRVRSNRALREASLEVFDRTFTVTTVLRALTVAVAFIGVLGALMALQLERTKEIGVLRANGFTRGQVRGLVLGQTGLMGLVAGVLSVPVGIGLAVVMVHVINRRAFGWTMELAVDPLLLLQAVGLGIAAAVLAGLHPARRLARLPPARALREE